MIKNNSVLVQSILNAMQEVIQKHGLELLQAVNEQDERHLDFIARAHNAMPSLLERIERLESAARITVENWENGDLAGAVRNLSDVLSEEL